MNRITAPCSARHRCKVALSRSELVSVTLFHSTMPRHRKKKSTAPQSSALSQFKPIPALDLETPSPPARESSSITVHPSVYNGGYPYPGSKEIFESIVCENDYAHLSPEVLHICTAESISHILRAMCVGVALPRPGDKYGSCSLGSTFVRGGYQ